MNPEIITTCINCLAPESLWATLIMLAVGAAMAVQYERRRVG